MQFDIAYGWKKWRGQRFRWLTLVVAAAMVIGLVGQLLQLGSVLIKDRPPWVQPQAKLMTLGYDLNGNLFSAKGTQLKYALKHGGVKGVTQFVLSEQTLVIHGQTHQQVNVLFYDDQFAPMLSAKEAFAKDSFEQQRVFATLEWADAIAAGGQVIGTVVEIGTGSIAVTDKLPRGFDEFASSPVDLYVPMDFYPKVIPVTGLDEASLRAYMDYFPFYNAVANVDDSVDAKALANTINKLIAEEGKDQVNLNLATVMRVADGIEFNPKTRQEILIQWQVLMLLVFGFGFIVFSNFSSVMSAQAVGRSQEYGVKVAVGASKGAIVRSLAIENLPTMLAIACLSFVIASGGHSFLSDSALFKEYFTFGYEFSWQSWLLALSVGALLLIVLSVLPLLNLLKRSQFARDKATQGRGAVWALRGIQGVQLTLALLAIMMTLSISHQEVQKQRVVNMTDTLVGYKLEAHRDQLFTVSEQLAQGSDNQFAGQEWVLSSRPLFADAPAQQKLAPLGLDAEAFFLEELAVSANLFDVLDVRWIVKGDLAPNQIVINQALANKLRQLGVNEPVGTQVELGASKTKQVVTISGIVANLPHSGMLQLGEPRLYRYLMEGERTLNQLMLYGRAPLNDAINTLPQWLKQQETVSQVTEMGTLKQQLNAMNTAGELMFYTSLLMASLIMFLLASGVYYQQKSQVTQQLPVFGVFLSVGDDKQRLQWRLVGQQLLLVLTCVPIVLLLLMAAQNYLAGIGLVLDSPVIAALSMLLLMVAVGLSSRVAVTQVLRRPIYQMLSHTD